jgi:preprotein translocase subunit SecE
LFYINLASSNKKLGQNPVDMLTSHLFLWLFVLNGMTDTLMNPAKWMISLVILTVGIIGFQYYQQYSLLLRVIAMLAVFGGSLAILATTAQGQQALTFIKAARVEARKVVWPGKQEVVQSTLVVMVMVFIVTLFLWLVDSILLFIMTKVTG